MSIAVLISVHDGVVLAADSASTLSFPTPPGVVLPQGQQGIVVSRVSFSPLLASQLVDLLNEQWQAYTEESGVPGEDE